MGIRGSDESAVPGRFFDLLLELDILFEFRVAKMMGLRGGVGILPGEGGVCATLERPEPLLDSKVVGRVWYNV